MAQTRFADRRDAGRRLANQLRQFGTCDPIVVALPRGGVPVAKEVALALGAPLEILAVRKLGAPHNPEYGIGAIAEDGTRLIDLEAVTTLRISGGDLEALISREEAELERRVALYRKRRAALGLRDRVVILVDDGVATGVSDTAAVRAVRRQEPRELILAVPVCAPDSAARLRAEVDQLLCLLAPASLCGVGQWYRDFSQVSDHEVVSILAEFSD